MKEFNLEEYLKNPSQKVITRDGREVRIICTDFKNITPVIGLVKTTKGEEFIYYYYENGLICKKQKGNLDLLFAPTKREGWINVFKDEELPFINGDIYKNEKEAKEEAIGEPDYVATIKIEWEE